MQPLPPYAHSWSPGWLQVCQKLQVSASMKLKNALFSQSRGRVSLEAHKLEVSGSQAWWSLGINQLGSYSSRDPHEGLAGGSSPELLVLAVLLGQPGLQRRGIGKWEAWGSSGGFGCSLCPCRLPSPGSPSFGISPASCRGHSPLGKLRAMTPSHCDQVFPPTLTCHRWSSHC